MVGRADGDDLRLFFFQERAVIAIRFDLGDDLVVGIRRRPRRLLGDFLAFTASPASPAAATALPTVQQRVFELGAMQIIDVADGDDAAVTSDGFADVSAARILAARSADGDAGDGGSRIGLLRAGRFARPNERHGSGDAGRG
jgi:hypothetical protein